MKKKMGLPLIIMVVVVLAAVFLFAFSLPLLSFLVSVARLLNPLSIAALITLAVLMWLNTTGKVKIKNKTMVFSVMGLLILFLISGGVGNFFSAILPETSMQWLGQDWAYAGKISASVDDVTLKLSNGCSNGGCTGYFRSDFDTSKYSEIRVLYNSQSSAAVGRQSSSASAYFNLFFGDAYIGYNAAGASSSGGAEVWSKTVTSTGSIVLKNEGDSWGVYSNEIKIKTVSQTSPIIKAEMGANSPIGDGGSGSSTASINLNLKLKDVITPIIPIPPSLSSIINGIKEWIGRIWDSLPFLAVTGSTTPVLGTSQTYQVSLSAPSLLDSDYRDGNYAVRYCNAALIRSDGTVVSEKAFTACRDAYSDAFTVVIPSLAGKYAVVALMVESKGTYDFTANAWTFTPYEVINKEALNIETKSVINPPTPPQPNPIATFFSGIWSFILGLFR